MKKIRLGIYIDDEEYGDRLTCYFMNHFNNRLEIHMYTRQEELNNLSGQIDIMLSSELNEWNNRGIPLIQIVEETPIEMWKWNEFGDVIRNMTRGISCAG